MGHGRDGFTLIELLIVVAIIGIITAIAIPNLLNAIDKGKQKRTMADIRSVGTACESYQVDQSHYPRNFTSLTVVTALGPMVEGPYLRKLPATVPDQGQLSDIRATGARGSTISARGRAGARSAGAPSSRPPHAPANRLLPAR